MKTLIIAFDGLDKEKIEEHSLENVPLEEFGSVDNHTGITRISTSELFASFITGETHEVHGIRGLKRFENDRIYRFESKHGDSFPLVKFKGLRESLYGAFNRVDGGYKRAYHKDDLQAPSIFDEIEGAKSLNVPAWNRNPFIEWGPCIFRKYGMQATLRYFDQEHRTRKEELFETLEDTPPLLMCHFHRPDAIQDLFYKFAGKEAEGRIDNVYQEMDELAGEIVERAEDKYDTIIFMSDHGLPTEHEHNENAFYSCNHELFPDREPHITDFHDKILELTGTEDDEVGGIKV